MSDTAAGGQREPIGPGTLLAGKYRVTRRLGDGSMGVVYAGLHERLGREVAIKVLRADYCAHPETAQRFQREAELVSKLGHPNIITVYDYGRLDDGGLYYVMELMTGRTLRERLQEGPLSDDEIVTVFAALLSAIQVAHGVGAVHRDLKPENVMLLHAESGNAPVVKLLDFGVAKIKQEPSAGTGAGGAPVVDALATRAGALMGTPAYMAPEQIKNSANVDGRADVYALGIMLFEALTGQRPFTSNSIADLIGSHLFKPVEKPSLVVKRLGLPPRKVNWKRLDLVVLKALAKEPAERYPDCASLRAELEQAWGNKGSWAAAGESYARTGSHSAEPAAAPGGGLSAVLGSRAGLGLAAAAALLVLVGGGVTLQRCSSGSSTSLKKYDAKSPAGLATARVSAAQVGGPAERRTLLATIESVHSRALLPALEVALQDESPSVWRLAVAVAGTLGKSTDTTLLAALASRQTQAVGPVAVEVASARRLLGVAEAAEVLNAAAGGDSLPPEVRLKAALTLAAVGELPAAALQKVFERSTRAGSVTTALRAATLLQLLKLGDENTEKLMRLAAQGMASEAHQEALTALTRAGKAEARTQLLSEAQKSAMPLQLDQLVTLAEVGEVQAGAPLLALLTDQTPRIRQRAVTALGALLGQGLMPETLPAVAALMQDGDPAVALASAVAVLAGAEAASARPRPEKNGNGK